MWLRRGCSRTLQLWSPWFFLGSWFSICCHSWGEKKWFLSWICTAAFFFNELSSIIINSGEENYSALNALRGAHEKAILFKAHRLRVLNQQTSIEKAIDAMRKNYINGIIECFITKDYKMKLDPIYYHEKQLIITGIEGWAGHFSILHNRRQKFAITREILHRSCYRKRK